MSGLPGLKNLCLAGGRINIVMFDLESANY